jgi:hypothetical protein
MVSCGSILDLYRFRQQLRAQRLAICAALIAAVLGTLALSGCRVKAIGDYDDAIDNGITDVQQRAELYFSRLQSTPSTPFDQNFYDDINSRLAVLKSRASSLPMYPIIVEQIGNLKTEFDTFQKLDKDAPRPIQSAIVRDAESAVTVSVESILTLELALKRGVTRPPTLPTKNK